MNIDGLEFIFKWAHPPNLLSYHSHMNGTDAGVSCSPPASPAHRRRGGHPLSPLWWDAFHGEISAPLWFMLYRTQKGWYLLRRKKGEICMIFLSPLILIINFYHYYVCHFILFFSIENFNTIQYIWTRNR